MSGKTTFRPGLWPTLAALPVLALLLGLGDWQLGRAAEKRALLAAQAAGERAEPVELAVADGRTYTRVRLSGRWDADHQVLLDAMTLGGRVGYRVLTPLVREHDVVLVDRGWVPADPDRRVLPDPALVAREVQVTGLTAGWPQPGLRAGAPAPTTDWPRLLHYPTHAELAGLYGPALSPVRVLLDAGQPDGLDVTRTPDGFGPERHLGYATTWFALAATLFIIWIVTNLRRED